MIQRSYYQRKKEEKYFQTYEKYKNASYEELEKLLLSDDSDVRQIAEGRLMDSGGQKVIDFALDLTKDSFYRTRDSAMRILGQVKGVKTEQVDDILQLLCEHATQDKSATVRAGATAALGHRCSNSTVNEEQINAVFKTLKITAQDHSPVVRELTAFSLASVDTPDTVSLLLKLLEDVDEDVVDWAAFAFNVREYDSPEIRDALAKLLDRKHVDIFLEAIEALGTRQDKRIIPYIRREFAQDGVYDLVTIAAGNLGDLSLLPDLEELSKQMPKNELILEAINKLKEKQKN